MIKAGDKVWIENTDLVNTPEQIRNLQTVEEVFEVPLTDENGENPYIGYSFFLVGLPYFYNEKDIKKEIE